MCLGIPGQIIEIINGEMNIAKVEISGVRRPVNIACVVNDGEPVESCVGIWVLVHVGFAMSRIDEEEAKNTLELIDQLGDFQQELDLIQQHEEQRF